MTTANRVSDIFSGDSEMASLMRKVDWGNTAVGGTDSWPESLRTAIDICLNSRFPMIIFWGPELTQFYNDAYRPIMGAEKHPQFLGQSCKVCWSEIWDILEPMMDSVLTRGESTWSEDLQLLVVRSGYLEETYFTFSYSPIHDGDAIGGIFCAVQETTPQVLGARRVATLRELGLDAAVGRDVAQGAADALVRNPQDIPFALVYLDERDDATPRLAGSAGATRPNDELRRVVEHVIASGTSERVDQIESLFDEPPAPGPWPEPVASAYIAPLSRSGQVRCAGAVVFGISPRRAFDDDYRTFLALAAAQISAELASASAYESERQRADQLAELDRAKTAFFSNISHEFRTPLTLLLGPLDDVIASASPRLSAAETEQLTIAQRNSRRLLRLVNTLLDFSRIEAGRVHASYEPTDIASYTTNLASMFRSAFDRAGIVLNIDCTPPSAPAYIDREMWEKVIMNLLSNALKFTFEGAVNVSMRERAGQIELTIADTGVGISKQELPRLFERFHRVEGTRSRTHEGTGIGLALVQELVHLHGGAVTATSAAGKGTTFTVTLPSGSAHLPQDRIQAPRTLASTATGAEPFIEEALSWLPEQGEHTLPGERSSIDADGGRWRGTEGMRVLVADDNADMRGYITRLLAGHWRVETVPDGRAALELARHDPPDLVVSDVMMPNMDGYELMHELRRDPVTEAIPIILLSARAGEEARIEGMEQGADDYLVKPFPARELIARVGGRLEIARVTRNAREAVERERQNLLGVIMQAPIPMVTLRGDDLVVEIANEPYDELVGHRATVGKPLLEAIPELQGQGFDELLRAVMHTGVPYIDREVLTQIDRGAGIEDIYVTFIYAPLRNMDGEIDGVIAVVSVVTEEVRARQAIEGALHDQGMYTEALERQQEELRQANAAKDEFLGLVSHELKTPITTIYGNAEVLRTRFGQLTADMRRGAIEDISSESERLHRIIDNLLVLARGQGSSDEPEPLLLRRLIDKLAAEHRRRFQARHIEIEDTVPSATVEVESIYVEQVMRNLLSNAEKYSPVDAPITIRIARDGAWITVDVIDRGAGFPEEEADSLFTPFFRSAATQAVPGIGIGLVVCKRIIEAHGGHMWARNGTSGGSEIGFALPAATLDAIEDDV